MYAFNPLPLTPVFKITFMIKKHILDTRTTFAMGYVTLYNEEIFKTMLRLIRLGCILKESSM